MHVSSKHRKSIIWWYENCTKTVPEIATSLRLDEAVVQKVIDDHFREPEPDPREADPRKRLADIIFEGRDEWERDMLMDDLVEVIKGEL